MVINPNEGEIGLRIHRSALVQVIFVVALTGMVSVPAMGQENATVAVWDLENLVLADSLLADMGEMLSAAVIETFKESGKYTVVERQRLLLVLEELNIGSSEAVSDSTRLEIGRIVGAGLMVFGSYTAIGETLMLDLRKVEVETGHILKATYKTTTSSSPVELLKLARETAKELL
jgi:curli biogenesis system outer membrane secretion channel CsgG